MMEIVENILRANVDTGKMVINTTHWQRNH